MNYKLIFRARALEEIQNAFLYYENSVVGLGEKFFKAFEKEVNFILKFPEHNKSIRNDFRQAYIKKYPFLIIYKISKNNIIVFSIFHTSRNPKNKF